MVLTERITRKMQRNKIRITVILCIIAVISIATSFSIVKKQSIGLEPVELNELTKEEWLKEYRYIWDYLENNSLVLDTLVNNGYDLELLYKDYEIKVGQCQNNAEYYKCLSCFFREFNGFAHLSILDYNFFRYSLEVYSNIESRAWTNILSEDSVKSNYEIWNNIIKNVDYKEDNLYTKREYVTKKSKIDNKADTGNNDIKEEADITEILKSYDIVLEDKDLSSIKESDISTYNNKGISVYVSDTENIITMAIEKDKTAYIKINSFAREYIEPDREVLYEFYNQIKDYDNLIIDIAENTGGSSYYWYTNIVMPNLKKDLVHTDYILYKITDQNKDFVLETMTETDELLTIDKLDKDIDTSNIPDNILQSANYFIKSTNQFSKQEPEMFKGKIWTLIGEKVYSSAETFSMFCKKTGFATLVGQTTGGNGMGGDPVIFALPYSKLIVRYDMSYGLNPDGTDNLTYGTTPDIKIN